METAPMWNRDLERRNRIVRRVLLAIVAVLVLTCFAIGTRW